MFELLKKSVLFRGIKPMELENLFKDEFMKVRKFKTGESIASTGEQVRFLIIVLRGSVRAEMLDPQGKIVKIEDIIAPNSIASAFIFGRNNFFPVDVFANENSSLLFIDKKQVLKMCNQNNQFLLNLLNSISNRSQFLAQRLRFLSLKTLREKMAVYLLKLSEKQASDTIILSKTQKELAEYFGVERTSFARVLSELKNEGLIKVKRRNITILEKELLSLF